MRGTYRETLLIAILMVYNTENSSIIMFSRSPSLAGVKMLHFQKMYEPIAPHKV